METLDELGKEFGVFYPRGHTVVAFSDMQNANKVITDLKAHAPLFDDTIAVTPEEMVAFAEANIAQAGILASMGTSLTTAQNILDLARTGAHFLVIHTPDDDIAAIAAAAIDKVPHTLAQRYHLLAIEDLP